MEGYLQTIVSLQGEVLINFAESVNNLADLKPI